MTTISTRLANPSKQRVAHEKDVRSLPLPQQLIVLEGLENSLDGDGGLECAKGPLPLHPQTQQHRALHFADLDPVKRN